MREIGWQRLLRNFEAGELAEVIEEVTVRRKLAAFRSERVSPGGWQRLLRNHVRNGLARIIEKFETGELAEILKEWTVRKGDRRLFRNYAVRQISGDAGGIRGAGKPREFRKNGIFAGKLAEIFGEPSMRLWAS